MITHTYDLRAWLRQSRRHWYVFALPMTLLIAMALLSVGNSQPLAPQTGALVKLTTDTPLLTDAATESATLIYHDAGRDERSHQSAAALD